MPDAGGDDVLRELADREVAAERDARVEAVVVDQMEVDRIALVVVPDFVGRDAMERGERAGGEKKVDRGVRGARPSVRQTAQNERRAIRFAKKAPFGMGREVERLDQPRSIHVHTDMVGDVRPMMSLLERRNALARHFVSSLPFAFFGLAAASSLWSRDARALDKQGSAHGGEVHADGDDTKFDIEGAVMAGVSLYNPTYAARPNNSGLTLFRYAAHVDIDLIGRKLSIPLDLNMFTDRLDHKGGSHPFTPSEGDIITGVTTTWDVGPGALEVGSRVEHDRPLDEIGFTQTYVDVRARYLYSLKTIYPGVARTLDDGDISGYFTLGWFAYNPTYAARPDNSGIAFLRYVWHYELSVWHDYVSIGMDATFFSDRRNKNPIAPTELDFTPEIIARVAPFEFHLAFERDHPLDQSGLVQEFVYMLAVYNFDLAHIGTEPMETRGGIISP